MLLSAMGIPDIVFESKQAHYFAQLAHMRSDPGTALKFLMTHAKVGFLKTIRQSEHPVWKYHNSWAVAAAI